MPLDPEDGISSATDISGDPQPSSARTPGKIKQGIQGKVQRQSQQASPQQQKNPLQQVGDALGGAAKGAEDQIKSAFAERPFQNQGADPLKDVNPINWAEQVTNDAATVWGLTRRAYQGFSGFFSPEGSPYSDAIGNIWNGDSAFDKASQTILPTLVENSVPLARLPQLQAELGAFKGAATGEESLDQAGQQLQQEEEKTVQQGPAGAAGTAMSAMFPEGKVAQGVAFAGLPALQSLLSENEDERTVGLAWSGITAAMLFGRVPAPMREALTKALPEWPALEGKLGGILDKVRSGNRRMVDPASAPGHVADWIEEQLNTGGALGERYSRPVAKAQRSDEPQRVAAEIDPEGHIRVRTDEPRKAIQQLLNRVGVEDVDELVHKAMTEGISDPKAIAQIKANWKLLKQPYDLRRYQPEEQPLRDPRRHLEELADQQVGLRHVSAVNHYLDQIHRGLFANHSDPMTAMLRALAGHSRTTQLTHQQYIASTVNALKGWGLNEQNMSKLMRAAEGDSEVYEGLPSEAKMVVDGWGLLRSAAREEAADTDYAKSFVSNWVPRTDVLPEEAAKGRGRPARADILAREAQRHRAESIQVDPQGHLVLGQRHQYVQDANRTLEQARIRGEYAPPKETNFLKNVNRIFGNQVRGVHTQQALNEFARMFMKDGQHAAVKPANQREGENLRASGYRAIADQRFQNMLFHPELADALGRYVDHYKSSGTRLGSFWQKALDLEGQAVKYIMISPLVHGMNVAGRVGMASLMHPLQMFNYLKNGKALLPHQWDEGSWALRSEAYNAGLLPHHENKSYMDNIISRFQDALGDEEEPMPRGALPDTKASRMKQLIADRPRPLVKANAYFWGMVNDFGVGMYHLEKTAAERHGLSPEAAMEYGARRANTWMGMVAPEDTNRLSHDMGRLLMFAPNWWRTWAELMVPIYRRSGFTQDPAYARFAAYQGAKTTMAAFAFQKLTGNLLNYALSGHLQNQNQPGNQDRLEATDDWVSALPGFGGVASGDPKTGGRRTIENPFARQTYDLEQAAGLQSGHPDYKPEDTWDGMAKFLASRAAPLFDAAWGVGNIDLYRSVADHQLRAVNPMEAPGSISPGSLLYGAIMLTPFGINFSQKVQQGIDQGSPTPAESAVGTKIPRSLQELVGDIGDPVGRTMFSWLTGVNAPYESSQRSRGQKPSDQDYQRAQQLGQQYQSRMLALSGEAMSGQMTPSQWRQAYHDLSQKHAAEMEALYKGAPEYVNGSQGMLSDWEKLYQDPRVVKPDGTVDQDQLAQLQGEFRSQHTPDQLQQMDALLHQNDTRYHMLALYHHSLDSYSQWQQQWAQQHNVDLNTLRRETKEYGALYGDARGQRQYLAQHRGLSQYEAAKKQQWNRSQAGMIYALFYGQNSTVVNYLRTHHLTPEQLIEQGGGTTTS